MVLGLLLAKRGVKTLVCESHPDFEREFRGEVLMPRFSQMMRQVGLLEFLESKPHLKLQDVRMFHLGRLVATFSFKRIAPEMPFALWMPQSVLLAALEEKARTFPAFQIEFGAVVRDLVRENGRITGAVVQKEGKTQTIRARVVVGADGRGSTVRRMGGFQNVVDEHDFDVIWFNAKKPAGHPDAVQGFFSTRHNYLILPKYPDLLQCGILVPPGAYSDYVQKGIESIKEELSEAHPVLANFAKELKDFSPFSVLQARVSRAQEWAKDGCLLVGDSAHTCSPAGAVGVSVAVHSAMDAADVIVRALEKNDVSVKTLSWLQSRREADVIRIQAIQKRVSRMVFPRNRFLSLVMPAVLAFLSRTSSFKGMQRRLFVLEKPLSIDPAFRFEK
jgi:2-polyprenyl-6-methoxyphenol hydroxylase-like FAD-dependent oxidoreductase